MCGVFTSHGSRFNFLPGFLPRRGRGRKKNRGFLPRRGRGEEKEARSRLKTRYTSRPRFYPGFPTKRGKNRGKIEKQMFNQGSVFK